MNTMNKKVIRLLLLCVAILFLNGIPVAATTAAPEASNDNSLKSLKLSEGALSPSFQYNVVNYTASVGNEITSVVVNAKTSHELAAIQSITGNTDLKEGANTIKIVVAAENGNLATYKITLTRASAGQASDVTPSDSNNDSADNNDTPSDDNNADSPDSIAVDAGDYQVVRAIPDEVIPKDFSKITVTYEDEDCEALKFDNGIMTLLYMEDESGNGALFIWNQGDGSTYPFIRLSVGEEYIILQQMPEDEEPNESFLEAGLSIDGMDAPSAYQNGADGMEDFYLVYAVNQEGVGGSYWYDQVDGTYQRYMEQMLDTSDSDAQIAALTKQLGSAGDKYTNLKDKDTKIIIALIIVIALLIILTVNLIILRSKKETDEETEPEEEILEQSKAMEEPEFSDEKIWKHKKEKKKKRIKRGDIFDDMEEDDLLDDADTFFDDGDFLEDEEIPAKKGESPSSTDELEILDLNDF